MPRRILALALLLALTGAVPIALAAPAAPGFRVKTIDGRQTIDSNELIGKKIVVLRFEASYCKACAREAGALNRLAERYRDRDVQFIAIHVQDTAADTRAFVRTHRITFPVALDPRLSLGNRFGFKGTPYTVVIDRKGEIVARLAGAGAQSRLPRILDASVKEAAAS
jgi:peroxiredoxin